MAEIQKGEIGLGMARTDTNFADLIAAVYEAGFDPSLWPAFLTKFEAALGGRATALLITDLRSSACSVTLSTLPADRERTYNEYYYSRNPWIESEGRSALLEKEVTLGDAIVSTRDLKRTEFYHDWLRPQELLYAIGISVLRMPSSFGWISTIRESCRGPFTHREVRLLTRLEPHMRRAIEAQRRNAADVQARTASVALLDRLPYGWIVTNPQGETLHINAAAKSMTGARQIDLRNPDLLGLIARVAQTGSGGEISMPRRRGRPLWVSVLPLRTPASVPFASGTLVGILISDPDRIPLSNAERIARYWRLTPAESELASALVEGLDIAAAADQLGIARTTARNQLGSVLNKTGARRQAELLRLLMSAPPQLELDQ